MVVDILSYNLNRFFNEDVGKKVFSAEGQCYAVISGWGWECKICMKS